MAFLQNRSISLVDMYIDNTEPSENVGQIHFSLEYDFQNTTLILRILTVSDRATTRHYTIFRKLLENSSSIRTPV
jgi:ribosome-associated toxin RatA of RatAB toxin-antitoxin module